MLKHVLRWVLAG